MRIWGNVTNGHQKHGLEKSQLEKNSAESINLLNHPWFLFCSHIPNPIIWQTLHSFHPQISIHGLLLTMFLEQHPFWPNITVDSPQWFQPILLPWCLFFKSNHVHILNIKLNHVIYLLKMTYWITITSTINPKSLLFYLLLHCISYQPPVTSPPAPHKPLLHILLQSHSSFCPCSNTARMLLSHGL